MGSSPHVAPRDQVGPTLTRVRVRAAELRPGLEESLAKVRARAGDLRPSFDEVVHRTFAMSTRVASRIVGDAEAVSDVLQDAYLNVYRSLERFRGASRYETWVYRIVVNAARSHLRRVRRVRARETALNEAEGVPVRLGDVVEAVDLVAQHIDVVALLARLGDADRELLTLRYLAGLSVAQVAAELGATENAIKVRLHRARRRLLALLAADGELDDDDVVEASMGLPRHTSW